jgi:hypothetical protein
MGAHEQAVGRTDEWYTPPEVFEALGIRFHMDVASPGRSVVPWVPAETHITAGSLGINWSGRVWMNPPFGKRNGYQAWAEKFVEHGHGIALAPDRSSAPWWQWLAPRVDAILFWEKKLKFLKPDGTRGNQPGTGTCLFALGQDCVEALKRCPGVLARNSTEEER